MLLSLSTTPSEGILEENLDGDTTASNTLSTPSPMGAGASRDVLLSIGLGPKTWVFLV